MKSSTRESHSSNVTDPWYRFLVCDSLIKRTHSAVVVAFFGCWTRSICFDRGPQRISGSDWPATDDERLGATSHQPMRRPHGPSSLERGEREKREREKKKGNRETREKNRVMIIKDKNEVQDVKRNFAR